MKVTDHYDSEKRTEIKYILIPLYWALTTSIQNDVYKYTYMAGKRIRRKYLLYTMTTSLFLVTYLYQKTLLPRLL